MIERENEAVVVSRKCRETGTKVELWWAPDADDTQPWETVCIDHGAVCSHETRTIAERFLSHPIEWCEECMAEMMRIHDGAYR